VTTASTKCAREADAIGASPVVALYRASSLSGVVSAGVRLAQLPPPHVAWRPLIVGPGLTRQTVASSPLGRCRGVDFATWREGADAPTQVRAVRHKIRELGARVVVPNDLAHGFVAAALEHHRGVRCAAWIHADYHDGDDLVLTCGELADTWRAVSARGAERVRRLDVMPTVGGVLPACVEVAKDCPPVRRPDGVLRLLYAGRIEKMNKRVLDLVRLADELVARGLAGFVLTVVGAGPAEGELRNAADAHIRAGRMELKGVAALSEMPGMYAASDVTVLVSASEGMPNVVMESLAAARPVAITTGCGGALDVVQDGVQGWVVSTGDMAAMAERLAEIVGDAQSAGRLREMGRAGHQTALARFSPVALGRPYDAMVREAMAAPERSVNHDARALNRRWNAMLTAMASIGPCPEVSVAALRSEWLRGLGVSIETPLPLRCERTLSAPERLLLGAVRSLREQGVDRIALYGAGKHTRKVEAALADLPEIVAIVDDRAGSEGVPDVLFGRAVVPPSDTLALGLEALVISSDEHEREMRARARAWFSGGPVVGLYT